MKTKRFVYEVANYKLSLIPPGQGHVDEAVRLQKIVKAAEEGLISPLEAVEVITRRDEE